MHQVSVSLAGTILATVALTGLTAAPALASTHGARGAGDRYFPLQGNGGYDVKHYDLRLRYDPASRHLRARTIIRATAKKRLTSFDLDFRRNLRISTVTVNGVGAVFHQPAALKQELVVRPFRAVAKDKTFTVVVRYAGTPAAITDPDGSVEGWVPTKDGAFVVGEPQGAPSWFPCNDTPRDKATYDFRVTVPRGVTAIANGDLTGQTRKGRWTTFRWHNREPMSTYLVTVTTGRFDVRTGTTPGGVPYYIASDPKLTAKSSAVLAKLPAVTDYLAELYGPYPFSSTGAIVDDASKVGYALETQTKPVYDRPPDELTLAHEAAHMYFGDSVTFKRWRDIWIAEGFAEFSSWMWSEHTGGKTAQGFFDTYYKKKATSSVWKPPPGNPGSAANLFSASVYLRGAMTLQALRVKLGDATFFDVLRSWHQTHRGRNVTVGQFRAFAEQRSGQDLSRFFDVWLVRKAKPTSW
ncbi:MAG: hypothetical protein QOE19_852 [Actinomycetota bacterium]|jgi:aminopeptidase N|nr:hypothetical protein [Actinomycetota bacterium]MDQ1666970.1 hypothetical protein [Actinomycetota bacterium]